ncbi:MAG: NAD(P)/FAD-dependent oxidoreductase [Methanomethylovorans sp.]|uniref:NAD(P)/FAD-dependent oxidoreductase n=1 Tax=Methanomethylovorans sp. TaxID=2758717 RepID=UPI00353083D2
MAKREKRQGKKLLIIGGGAVGMAVSTGATRHGNYEVTVISSDKHASYSQCGIPYVFSGEIPNFEQLIVRDLEFFQEMGIKLRLGTQVDSIDLTSNTIRIGDEKLAFDKLVIATGSKASIPRNIETGTLLKNVFTLRTLSDGMHIAEALKDAKNVVIIGAGSIGCEVAIATARRGIRTSLLSRSNTILSSSLDSDMAETVISYLEREGVEVLTEHTPESLNGEEKITSVTANGREIPADVVLISVGVTPNTSLAAETGIDIGTVGGILTNDKLQVLADGNVIENVFAGGECTQINNFVTGKPMLSQLASTARRMAGAIIDNLADKDIKFNPVVNPWVAVVGDLQIGSVGVTTKEVEKQGIRVISGISTGSTHADYFPGAGKIFIKVLFHNRCLVGAQIVSTTGTKERIDGLSLAIKRKQTIDELLEMETCYSPVVSTLQDPLLFAVKGAHKKMPRKDAR